MDSMGTPRSTLQLIRRGQFARLWFAGVVSSLGDWVSLFATLALGNALGGTSGVAVPLLGRFLPAVLFGAVSGVIADRFDNRKVMYVSDFARGVLVLGLVFVDSLTALFFVTMAIEMFSLVRQPAREAAMATIVSGEELMRANSVSVLATYGSIPVAGIIWTVFATITVDGAWTSAFVFDSITFMTSAVLMLLLTLPARATVEEREQGGWDLRAAGADFVEGIRYVGSHPRVRIPVFGIVGALFGGAALFVLGEPFSQDVLGLGSRGFGIVAASLGLGIAGGVFLANFLERIDMEIEFGFAISLALAGLGVFVVAFTDLLVTAAAGAALAGLGTGGTYVLGFTAIHAAVDDDLRGRTFGALFTLGRVSVVLVLPIAPLIAIAAEGLLPGELGDGIRFTLAVAGVIVSIAGLLSAVATARTVATQGPAT
ncbi:MAG: MFS transporter [Acidimicrobiia bacterium]|nr:MFS transporter [Acidimicrobiia bacterium]